jgi:hypothetical protein
MKLNFKLDIKNMANLQPIAKSTSVKQINLTNNAYRYDENGHYLLPDKLPITTRLDGFGFKLAKTLKDWQNNLNNLTYPLIAESKLDGIRCQIIIIPNKDFTQIKAWPYTRAGNKILAIDHIVKDLESHYNPDYARETKVLTNEYPIIVLDGELQDDSATAPFRIVNGLANRNATDIETETLHYHIYNMYYANRGLQPISQIAKHRYYDTLSYLGFSECNHVSRISCSYLIATKTELIQLINELRESKAEGLIIKSINETINNNRTSDWLKIKFKKRGTFRLSEIIPGEGKCAGTAGAIVVTDRNGNQSKVGTGFTDCQRDELFKYINSLATSPIMVEIEYMALTKGSLREAVYLGIRQDIRFSPEVLDIFEDRG